MNNIIHVILFLLFSSEGCLCFYPHEMNKNDKLYIDTKIKSIFFVEIGIGVAANSFLFLFHVLVFLHGHRPRLTDLPIAVLALVNGLMLLLTGFIGTDIFMSWGGWDTVTCKSLLFLYRALRGLCICASCTLSVLQAIALSPTRSCLAKFKHKSPCHNLWTLLILYVFYASISSHLLLSINASTNLTSGNFIYITKSCFLMPLNYSMQHIFSTLLTFREAFLIGTMALSSGYMVILLCRHKRRCQHLHTTSSSPKVSPEESATRTILLLVSFFIVMSILDSINSSLRTLFKDDPLPSYIQIFVPHSYATISPFVVINNEKRIIKFLSSMCGKTVNIFYSVRGKFL